MRIFTHLRLVIGACLLVAAATPAKSRAESNAACEGIAKDVMTAIHKDTAKTLLIVEDALVINEGCAAEIVKAAITASKADAALVNQIVVTANGVAPKKAAVIAAAANEAAPGALVASVNTGAATGEVVEGQGDGLIYDKNPVVVLDKQPVQVIDKNPVIVEEVKEEFEGGYVNVRGIYLIQPPPVGIPPPPDCKRKCDNVPTSPCKNVCKPMTPHKVYGKDYAVK